MYREEFVRKQMLKNSKADKTVLRFIYSFFDDLDGNTKNLKSRVNDKFLNGYCFCFAVILEAVFNRGEVCWAAPHGHIVWKDDNGVCYDAGGCAVIDAKCFIPVSEMGDMLKDFKHIPGETYNATDQEIAEFVARYEEACTE